MVEGSRGTIRRRTCLFDIVVCRRTSRLQQNSHHVPWRHARGCPVLTGDEEQCVDQQRSSDLTRRDYYQIGQSRRSHKPLHQQVSKSDTFIRTKHSLLDSS